MQYIFILRIEAEKSNLSIEDKTLGNWRYSWNNNIITAITYGSSAVRRNLGATFEELETPQKLGLLVDALTFCSDLCISAKINYDLFELTSGINIEDTSRTFAATLSEIIKNKKVENGSSTDEWPIRINPGTSNTFSTEKIEIVKFLLDAFSKVNFVNTKIKLLSYWRRGFDLNELTYWDESFLACFKILEFFEKQYCRGKNKLIDKRIKLVKTGNRKKALKIGGGVNLPVVDNFLVKLLSDAINVRNNFDIAHMRIRPLPQERNGALYFTYYDQIWDLHDDLLELTRFFILKYFGVKGVGLKGDGGLLKPYLPS